MPDLPQTRQSLLIRLQQQSEDAWSEFLSIYEKSILDYARRRGLQDADAQDVTQEVLAAVGQKVNSWESDPEKGKFRGWLFRVARNIAVDKIIEQSKKAELNGSRAAEAIATQARDQESLIFWNNYRKQLMHWAAEKVRPHVSKTSWQAFWMTAIEGQPAPKVAQALDLAIGNVYAAKFRIVARIRETVERFDDAEELQDLPLGKLRGSPE